MPLNRGVIRALNIAVVVLTASLVLTLVATLYLFSLSKTLPDVAIDSIGLSTPRTSIVYAADGTVLAEWHGEQDRKVVVHNEISPNLRHAVVSIEDRRFYEHNGVDWIAISRAMRVNAESGQVREGGSTITQQLVKILFTDGERTFSRKLREALLAYELEARTDKEKVLELYLNTVYFGRGAYGIESAARNYFDTSASSLSLEQSALLAGVIRSPSRSNPFDDPGAAVERRNLVLSRMHDQGFITAEQMTEAQNSKITLARPKQLPPVAPYFVEYVKQDLIERLGPERVYEGGLRVYTTLDPALQRHAEKSALALSSNDDPEVALVSVRHSDGAIVAMVGGRDFASNQFNLAAQGLRQPGSAFKPFVLAAALNAGVRPEKKFSAAPYSVQLPSGTWHVQNYEKDASKKRIKLSTATTWSINTVYARLIMQIGPEKVVRMAKKLGIVTPLEANPAIALGGLTLGVSPLEMASAYGTLANRGMRVAPRGILRVTDDSGRPVFEPELDAKRAVSRRVADTLSLMLHDVIATGTGTSADIGRWAAGKTGTTQSYRDAWFVGWSGDLTTAVWVGHPKAQVAMTNVHGTRVTGGSFPARIWAAYMKPATTGSRKPLRSDGSVVRLCTTSMQLANPRCPESIELQLKHSDIPETECQTH
jgi:penicillin-binding protein 1A